MSRVIGTPDKPARCPDGGRQLAADAHRLTRAATHGDRHADQA